ncbi:hypothetical protein TNCV_2287761 [Trichonephila clavipes]|nr:hypothetical protein TNCV_2287761 [Trichonephila clavipes]
MCPRYPSSQGNGLMGSWHEFEPGTVEDPTSRGSRCTLNMSRLEHPPVGMVWKLGEGDATTGDMFVT